MALLRLALVTDVMHESTAVADLLVAAEQERQHVCFQALLSGVCMQFTAPGWQADVSHP